MANQKNESFEHTAAIQFMKQIDEAFIELIDCVATTTSIARIGETMRIELSLSFIAK